MPFKVKGYKRLENRETIEVHVQNPTLALGGLVHISGRSDGVYFNGKLCYVPRLCQIMDDTECDGMTLEVVDGKSLYFTLDESGAHSWTTGNPGIVRHSVKRNHDPYVTEEFTLTVKNLFDSRSRGNGTYSGDDKTRIYLNGKNVLTWPDIFLEGNRIKKIVWHWYYCATMDKYVKRLSEVWFVNSEIDKEEIKMSKTIKEVWESMTREQQDVCCVLIGEAAKKNSSLDYEIKRKVAAIRAGEYMIRVTGSDIRDIVFNGPATIILWRDGSKTVIKQQKGDKWDPEKAVAMAVMKKVFGTNETGSNYLEFVRPYIEKALEEDKKRKAAARRKKRTDKDISK